jgi:hypothetical protein
MAANAIKTMIFWLHPLLPVWKPLACSIYIYAEGGTLLYEQIGVVYFHPILGAKATQNRVKICQF